MVGAGKLRVNRCQQFAQPAPTRISSCAKSKTTSLNCIFNFYVLGRIGLLGVVMSDLQGSFYVASCKTDGGCFEARRN